MKRHNFLSSKLFHSCILATLLLNTACVDTVILPDNKTVDDEFWQKKSEVDAVVATAYAQLRDATAIRNMIVWGDFRSDELVVSSALPVSAAYRVALQQIYSMNIDTENAFTSWFPFYSAINYCNLVLDRAEGVIAVDPDYMQGDYDANKAQMLALRAFCYFYLTRVFHDVPVTPHAYMNSSDDLNAVQAAPDSVLSMCIADLNEAVKYAVAGDTYGDWRDKGYFNKDGINALLADIYLWRASINRSEADYEACIAACDEVIKAKKAAYERNPTHRRFGFDNEEKEYYLADYTDMYNDLFGEEGQNATESIFELQFKLSNTQNGGLDQVFYRYNNGSANPSGYLSASTKFGKVDPSAAGNGVWTNSVDQRLYEYVYNANSDAEQYGVRKAIALFTAGYNNTADATRSGRANVLQNWIIYRLTDVMLMKAEALVQLYEFERARAEANNETADDAKNQQAFAICQFVNDRALSEANKATYSLKYSSFRDRMEMLVLAERARELCFEGKRWYDLMRYNYRHTATKADLTKKLSESYVSSNSDEFYELALRKYTVPGSMRAKMRDERYLYMPINQSEVDVNPNLVQNPVYKSSAKY